MNRKMGFGVLVAVAVVAIVVLALVFNLNIQALPSAPTELRALGGVDSVSLTWSAPSNVGTGITGYNVYRSVEEGHFNNTPIATVTSNHTMDSDLSPGQYHYVVRPYNKNGEGPESEIATANVTGFTPNASFTFTEASPGNYTFTLLSISRGDLRFSSFSVNATQDGQTLQVSGWTGAGEYLTPGVSFTIGWMRLYVECVVIVTYVWTDSSVWGISFNPTW